MSGNIRELMTEEPHALASGATVMEAARLMRDEDMGIVPVVDGDKLVGLVTERDFVRALGRRRG